MRQAGRRCDTGGLGHGQDMRDRSRVMGGRPWEIGDGRQDRRSVEMIQHNNNVIL